MRFVVCGAGAIGGVLGGQFAKAGYDVILIDKLAAHVEAINRDGLRLKGVHGESVLRVPAVTRAVEAGLGPGDAIILSVKSFHTNAAVAELRQATPLDLPVFCAQNGVRNEEVVARAFREVNGVMVLFGAKRMAPGEVVQTNRGVLGVGTYPAGLSPAAREVAAAVARTDIAVYTTERIVADKWNKLLTNLNNATFGLTGVSVEEARADAEVRAWMADVLEEGVGVLRAASQPFDGPPGHPSIEERIRELRGTVGAVAIPDTEEAKHRPSLWQDLYHRTGEVEADAFNGEIVALGRQHGVPTPRSSLLLELVTEMARARELPGKYTVKGLRARLTQRDDR